MLLLLDKPNNRCDCRRGKAIGGSTTINAMNFVRGNWRDFDAWDSPGWSAKDVYPYFIHQERSSFTGEPGYHGREGFIPTDLQTPSLPLTDVFLQSFLEKGMNVLDYNGREQLGIGVIQKFTKGGRRVSAANSVLEPVLQRKNLDVVLDALATNIIVNEEKEVGGVDFMKKGKIYRALARREVIVSCGAIGTPQLLKLSGIGPKNELEELGIPLIQNLPVGHALKDHVFLALPFTTSASFKLPYKEMIYQYLDGNGALTNGPGAAAVAFIQTNRSLPEGVPDAELVFISPNSSFQFVGAPFDTDSTFVVLAVLLKPKSTGTVTLKSKDPRDFPEVDQRYFTENEDLETLYRAAKFVLSLAKTRAFEEINATYFDWGLKPCRDFKLGSKDYFQCYAKYMTNSVYHYCCTASIGRIVDERLRVFGIKKLRVADAAVMPDIISGHLTSAVYMIGQKAVDLVLEDNHLL